MGFRLPQAEHSKDAMYVALWMFPALWRWRQSFYDLPGVAETCDGEAWRADYFGALFPLNPGGIIPAGPDLCTLIKSSPALP